MPRKNKYIYLLENDLTPYLVERVKDGLTYEALHNINAMYLEMVPTLKPIEKACILALLIEDRENAILATSKEGQNNDG